MTARRFASQWCDPSPRTASHPRTRSAARRTCAGAGAPCGTRRGTRPCSRRCALRCARPARLPACPPARLPARSLARGCFARGGRLVLAPAPAPSPRTAIHRAFTAPSPHPASNWTAQRRAPTDIHSSRPASNWTAQVGPNGEGPLPWVERDYTPVSDWAAWERGVCDILIKVCPLLPTSTPTLCRSTLSRPHTDSPFQRTQSGLPRKPCLPTRRSTPTARRRAGCTGNRSERRFGSPSR